MKKTNQPSYSTCELYLAMIKNPPRKPFILCKEEVNLPLLHKTGEIEFYRICQTYQRFDKPRFKKAEQACFESLKDEDATRPALLNKS